MRLKSPGIEKLLKWTNPQFVQLYIDRVRSIYLNLNNEILENLRNKTLKSSNVAFMTHIELKPKKVGKTD